MSAPTDPPTSRPAIAQFSLGTLFLSLTWLALVCIGLSAPNRLWSDLLGFLSVLALLIAVLVAIYGREKSRAFAVGFALFGCADLFCLHRFDGYAPRLLARESAEAIFRITHHEQWSPIATRLAASTTPMQRLADKRDRTVEIAQAASVMLVAALGGNLARYLSGRKRTDAP